MATPKIACKLGEGSKTLIRLPELAAPALKICLATAIKQQQQHEAFQRRPKLDDAGEVRRPPDLKAMGL